MNEINNAKEGEAPSASAPATPDFSQLIDKVLSNPEIITTVASALSQMSADSPEKSAPEAVVEPAPTVNSTDSNFDAEAVMKKLPNVLKALSSGSGGVPSDKRSCLLAAIKPYLSPARCEAIDYIIRFSQLSEIMKTIN